MSRIQIFTIATLTALMAAVAFALGHWAESLNPNGILPHPAADGEQRLNAEPRDAFTFGASMGLLGISMIYCLIAAGLLLRSKASGKLTGALTYSVAGLAAIGFVLSYAIDDFFY